MASSPYCSVSKPPILDGATPINRTERTAQYRKEGWNRFDKNADPYDRQATASGRMAQLVI